MTSGCKKAVDTTSDRGLLQDFLASIVVFLVALPLCMGIAIASGAPPAAGIIAGIVGGLIVAPLAGCPLQVTGPAAGLTVIVFDIIQKHGLGVLGVTVLIAGVIQLLAGVFKLGQWFRAVSPAVINGMLSGIGILILASQFHVMLELPTKGSGIENLMELPVAIWRCLDLTDGDVAHVSGIVGLATIASVVVWQNLPFKATKSIPAPLVAVLIATSATAFFDLQIKTVSIPDSLLSAVQWPHFNELLGQGASDILGFGLALAVIASAETLLTATAVDKLQTRYKTKYDKELMAQGIGNVICGALGALPLTGVIVRSSVNVQAGAASRLSSVMHGFWLLLFAVCLPFVLRLIPIAALAALLVYTGYKLTNFKVIKSVLPYGKSEVAIYIATLTAIVFTDLLTGVILGVALSAAKLLYKFSHLDIEKDVSESGQTTLHLAGAATFLSLPKLAATLETLNPDTKLHVQVSQLTYIDHACLELLADWETQHVASGGRLVLDWGVLHERHRPTRGNGTALDSTGVNGVLTTRGPRSSSGPAPATGGPSPASDDTSAGDADNESGGDPGTESGVSSPHKDAALGRSGQAKDVGRYSCDPGCIQGSAVGDDRPETDEREPELAVRH